MTLRITNKMLVTNSLSTLNKGLEQLESISGRLAAGKKLLVPSDDPIGTGNVLRMHRGLAETRQYVANADYGIGMMLAADSALTDLTEILQRARELAVYGANGTLPADSLHALAKEVNELVDHAVQVANSTYGGSYVFGGQETTKPPYAIASSDTEGNIEAMDDYQGSPLPTVVEVGPGSTLEINVPGNLVFEKAFEELISLRKNLSEGKTDEISSETLGNLDGVISQVLRFQAEVGAKGKRLEITQSRLKGLDLNLQTLISKTEDIDVAEAIMMLKMQENAYRLALDTTARIIQPTLMDFLR